MEIVGPVVALRMLTRSEVLDGPAALARGLYDAVATADQDLDAVVDEFLTPILGQVPQVLRAFKALVTASRRGLSRKDLEELETEGLAETWVHPDHWTAADKILSPRR